MKVIAVDDEKLLLLDLLPRLSKHEAVDSATGFISASAALEHLKTHEVDAAFLDVVMPEMNGLALAKAMKDIRPNLKIVFLTAHRQYALDAFTVHASGYLLKPPQDDDLAREIAHLAHGNACEPSPDQKRIVVQTFGNFEVFADGEPIRFTRSKSKEILAYLIDRQGASATKKEIAAVIWEDGEYSRSRQFQLETLIRAMIASLKSVNADQIVVRSHNNLAVNKDALDCDYYRFCAWDITAINSYKGEYMSSYSWAEFTAGYLNSKIIT